MTKAKEMLVYEGPADFLEVVGFTITRGVETEVDKDIADRLRDYPGVTFSNEETPLSDHFQKVD
jgi:hypothetical protein